MRDFSDAFSSSRIKALTSFLQDPDVLPHSGTPYRLLYEETKIRGPVTDRAFDLSWGLDPANNQWGLPYGHLKLSIWPVSRRMEIADIRTQPQWALPTPPTKGIGRELVRRVVLVAAQNGFSTISTTNTLNGAMPFWCSLGFLPTRRILVDWTKLGDAALGWMGRYVNDPRALWDLARTPEGRTALHQSSGETRLRLADRKQRDFALKRLHLDAKLLSGARAAPSL